jgi:hypothetical protein
VSCSINNTHSDLQNNSKWTNKCVVFDKRATPTERVALEGALLQFVFEENGDPPANPLEQVFPDTHPHVQTGTTQSWHSKFQGNKNNDELDYEII